jgi:acyl-CoA synthetase (NDP forming)
MVCASTAGNPSPICLPTAGANLRAILAPRSIAVIGASRRENTIGHQILHNLITFGFIGAVYSVNPRGEPRR